MSLTKVKKSFLCGGLDERTVFNEDSCRLWCVVRLSLCVGLVVWCTPDGFDTTPASFAGSPLELSARCGRVFCSALRTSFL